MNKKELKEIITLKSKLIPKLKKELKLLKFEQKLYLKDKSNDESKSSYDRLTKLYDEIKNKEERLNILKEILDKKINKT